jgi:uncharacterized repeat protein (TIGR02543 family)
VKTLRALAAALCGALLLSGCSQFFDSFASMGIYAVQFEEDGGSAVEDRRASLIAAMPVPTKAGQAFEGWYTAANGGGEKVSFPYDPLANATLYAKWIPATDGLIYSEYGDGYKVWPGSATGAVTIPAWWNGKPVTTIGDWAFSGAAGLTSVIIPDSVTSIGSGAFYPCAALQNIEVKAATPPEGYDNMFQGCGNLSAISVPAASVAAYKAADGWDTYAAKIVGDTVSFNSFTISFDEDGGTAVADATTSLIAEIPVSSKEGYALEGWYTAANGGGSKVSFPYDPLADATLYAKWITATEGLSYAASGSGYSVSNSTATGAITIPAYWRGKPVVAIESWAFSDANLAVTSINIPSSVTQIGSSAFLNSPISTTITLPPGLTYIGQNAFKQSDIASIEIPSAVTYIGSAAFYNCALLTTVTVQAATPPETFTNVFLNTDAALSIKIPAGTLSAYTSAYGWNAYTAKISE